MERGKDWEHEAKTEKTVNDTLQKMLLSEQQAVVRSELQAFPSARFCVPVRGREGERLVKLTDPHTPAPHPMYNDAHKIMGGLQDVGSSVRGRAREKIKTGHRKRGAGHARNSGTIDILSQSGILKHHSGNMAVLRLLVRARATFSQDARLLLYLSDFMNMFKGPAGLPGIPSAPFVKHRYSFRARGGSEDLFWSCANMLSRQGT